MKKSRLVWLGAFIALMAMLGTSAIQPKSADAATAAIRLCKQGTGTSVGQTYNFQATFNGGGGIQSLVAGAVGTPNCAIILTSQPNDAGPVAVAIAEQIPGNTQVTGLTVTGGAAGAISTGPLVDIPGGRATFTLANLPAGTDPGIVTVTYTNAPCTDCPIVGGTTVTVRKECVGAPTGTFTLAVGTGTGGQSFPGILCGGTTGAVAVTAGQQITVGEPTVPAGITATIQCGTFGVINAGTTTITPVAGQNITCVVRNTVGAAGIIISPTSKICEPYQPIANVVNCDLAVLFPQGLPGGYVVDVEIAGATFLDSQVALAIIAGCPGATVTRISGTAFRIVAPAGGCVAGTTIVVSEKINCGTTNTITQTLRLRATVDGTVLDTRSITATGPGGQPFILCTTAPIVNAVFAGASKICTPYTPIAGVLNCDLNLPLASPGGIPGGATIDVTLAPSSAAAFRFEGLNNAGIIDVLVVQGCPGAVVTPVLLSGTGSTSVFSTNQFRITAPAQGCPFPATLVVSQKINCLANITPGLLSETVLVRNAAGTVIGTAAPGLVVPFTGPGGQPLSFPCNTQQAATAVKVCQPVVDGVPASTTTQVFTRVGQVTTCTVTITNTSAGQVSPAGNVTVTLSNASFAGTSDAGALVTNIGAVGVGGTTATFPCAAIAASSTGLAQCSFTESFVAGPNACTTIGQTITSITGGPFSFSFSPIVANSSVAGSPQIFVLPKIDSGIVCPGQVSGFAGNDLRFVLRCNPFATLSAELAAATAGVIPGPIGGAGNVLALGILPSAIICEAGFLAAGDALNAPFRPAAPGTIEASSLNGTLIDLRGGVTTNLRIGCGTGATVNLDNPIGVTVDVNTCLGVRFGVIGLGVGFVELRARYEPNSAAAAAGVREREATGQVAFIAPSVAVNLLLNPNPVGVGQTGTATARFNRATIFGGELLVNPQTGIPLTISLGTPLNGTVTFTTSNAAVASFTGGLQTGADLVTGVVPGTGIVVGTGSSVTVRCGTATPIFAGAGIPNVVTAASFASFFGGCTDASAAYRGNLVGNTQITATFVADLPGAFGSAGLSAGFTGATVNSNFGSVLGSNVGPLFDLVGGFGSNSATATLEVVQLAATTIRLVPGCNNVVAPANETVAQVAARVDPASAVISVWKQIPGTTMFQGAAIGQTVPAGVSNLANVNALDAIFICVNAAATYRIT